MPQRGNICPTILVTELYHFPDTKPQTILGVYNFCWALAPETHERPPSKGLSSESIKVSVQQVL